jgi:hypothetical protein
METGMKNPSWNRTLRFQEGFLYGALKGKKKADRRLRRLEILEKA